MLQPTAETSGDGKQYGSVVKIADSNGAELVNLIVGKRRGPRGATTVWPARRSASSARLVATRCTWSVSPDAITTKFQDWIEQDLLKPNSFDVAKLDLHDYSLVLRPGRGPATSA